MTLVGRRAVDVVAPGFDHKVRYTARISARLWAGLRLHREFINGVNRQHDARNARNAALVHSGNVVPQVIVVDSIDLPIHLVSARPVHRTESPCRVASKSRL